MAKPRKQSILNDQSPVRRRRGFEPAGSILGARIGRAAEARGFAISRLLTQWEALVGQQIARSARPVRVSHAGREGFGGTLVLLCQGTAAPLIEMEAPAIREKVNAVYGYNAIARIRITQTAPEGFAEAQTPFAAAPRAPAPQPLDDPLTRARSEKMVASCADPDLRAALARLAAARMARRAQ
ncbi:MAG: DUF721 domain-containing protein [Paracoccus sp. (in: a-proteobacteria)]|nr:DUF721 domain-containing protein [Paracoccus sp. (in: a-proteobacteria)]